MRGCGGEEIWADALGNPARFYLPSPTNHPTLLHTDRLDLSHEIVAKQRDSRSWRKYQACELSIC